MFLKDKIINWLKNYSKENNNLCFIVGVSGGIDSAVVSTLCSETEIETHVVSIPILQNKQQLDLAKKHINWLKSKYKNVVSHEEDLTDVYLKFKETLLKYDNDLGWANTRSRFRMITLYQLSSYYRGLVVGTGNKIEDFGVGFFTKYGDGGVDISPIADLTKTEVRQIAKDLLIDDEIILAKPTDGLWDDNRSDEDQIGASYEELEWAMDTNKNLIYNPLILDRLTKREKEVLNIYRKFNTQNKHKMITIPIYKK